jgi:hypothetical membrane protein
MTMATDRTSADARFDRASAVTRSLLGYGVIVGPIYVVTGLAQALLREGFDLSRHSLSLLANGPWGWVQVLNLVIAGLMTGAAAVGFVRALRPVRAPGVALAVNGACLVLSGVSVADPMDGFPPGTPAGLPAAATTSGVLHLAAGGLAFVALAVAHLAIGKWFARRHERGLAVASRISGIVVLVGFIAGGALAATPFGVPLLWLAVLVGWGWLATASVAVYKTVPHPDGERRS